MALFFAFGFKKGPPNQHLERCRATLTMGQGLACVIPEDEPQPIFLPTRNVKPWTPQTTNKEDERTIIGRQTLRC